MTLTGWNEYDAARHCLEAPNIAVRMAPFIGVHGFDWEGILEEQPALSSGEQILIDAAHMFWNTRNDEGVLGRALHTLDAENTRRLIEAILIYCRVALVQVPIQVMA